MAILTPDRIYMANGLKVKEYFLTKHNPYNISMPTSALPKMPVGITVHNTEWIRVSSSTTPAEQYTRATLNGNMNSVRVHYYVDNVCAWQNLPHSISGWHAADNNGNGNRKTIAIECIMDKNGGSHSEKSEENCAKLVAYLLDLYGMTVEENLFTHTHWLNVKDKKTGSIDYLNTASNSYKNCPAYILPHWEAFKTKVKSYMKKKEEVKKENTENKKEISQMVEEKELYRVRTEWSKPDSQIGAFSSLENAKTACKEGYSIFNNKGEKVFSKTIVNKTPTSSAVKPIENKNEKIDVIYQVYSGGKWWDEVVNYNDINSDGYAGVENKSVRGFAAKVSKGKLKYRVHVKNGGWLSFITNCNIKDWSKGCAGLKTKDIDAIQIGLEDLEGYTVRYRVSTIANKSYLEWVTGYNEIDSNGYAGIFGKTIDKIQVEIVKI